MKKIAVLILASAVFFLSCKTTRSSAENAGAQNLSGAEEISRTDEHAENEIAPESESEENSAPEENHALASDEMQGEQNADEKNKPDENAQFHDENEIEKIAGGFAHEFSPDEASQETDSSSTENAPHGNASETESEENSVQAESAAQENVPAEETVARSEPHGESAPQSGQTLSREESSDAESEKATAENGREEDSAQNETAATENGAKDGALPRDSAIAESSSAQGNSDSQTQSATQTESQNQSRSAVAHNSAGENSARQNQNQNSRERQNNAPQNRQQGAPADSTQTEQNNASASERDRARANSTNENSAQTVPPRNSARENSETEHASSRTERADEIASAYDFTGDGENASESAAKEKAEPPVPSRSLTLKRNQFVDIIYPGNGWIYLGEEGGDHFTFYGRKQRGGESTFTLRSKKAGRALLHFYKNDALTGKYIDDYIELNVTQETALDASHVEAPSYAQAVPQRYERKNNDEDAEEIPSQGGTVAPNSDGEKNLSAETTSAETVGSHSDEKNAAGQNASDGSSRNSVQEEAASEKVQTVIQTSRTQEEAAPRTSIAAAQNPKARNENSETDSRAASNAASLLELAQKAYDEKRYADALDFVRKFLEAATENIDAGIFLEGQILEAKSEVRDIKAAIGDYDTIVKNWPQSKFWRRANERGIYLKRFYIDIR